MKSNFRDWLRPYESYAVFANGPTKESSFLSYPVKDANLLCWSQRVHTKAHQVAKNMKYNKVPICNVTCFAHNPVMYKPSRMILNDTDKAKLVFGHHCSLYDCVEIALWLCSK